MIDIITHPQEFPLEHMEQAIDFYDEKKNDKTRKRKHFWKVFQHRFRKVKNHRYIERFRKYVGDAETYKSWMK